MKLNKSFYLKLLLLFVAPVLNSQILAQTTNSNYEPYESKGPSHAAQSSSEKIVDKNIDRAYKALNNFVDKHGNKLAEKASQQKDKVERFGNPGPERNPLDKQGGHLSKAHSRHEYKMDSLIILEKSTFPICLEPRLIAERNNLALNLLNPVLAGACRLRCPPLLFKDQDWKVISYYWPETEISVNKAGAQMIDVDIVEEGRGTKELYRLPTQEKEQNDPEKIRGKEEQVKLLDNMGIPASDAGKFRDPEYHRSPREFHLRQDGELRYPSAFRPNAFWRAADNRPNSSDGYAVNDRCLFDALDPPTGVKKVISNRLDQGIYAVLARYPELRKNTDPERYLYTSPQSINLEQYKNSEDKSFQSSLCASWRMSSNNKIYGELQKVSFSPNSNNKYKDYCLPGSGDLSGSMVATEGTPLLQADAARAVMAAIWLSSTNPKLSNINKPELRLSKFSLYQNRNSIKRNRYVHEQPNPSENESAIVWADKLQRIYPTQPIAGDPDGIGGASSKGLRNIFGQRGSQCFRPEDIPNWSSEDNITKSEWPLGLLTGPDDHFGETRWAIWNQRIVCACETLGVFSTGCSSLNNGDHDEEVFAGPKGYTGQMVPPPFVKALPIIKGFATKEEPPSHPTAFSPGSDLAWLTLDTGIRNYTEPLTPLGTAQSSTNSGKPITDQIIICMLPEDQNPPNQNQTNNGSTSSPQPAGGNNSPNVPEPPVCTTGTCPYAPRKSINSQKAIIRKIKINSLTSKISGIQIGDTFECPNGDCLPGANSVIKNNFSANSFNEVACSTKTNNSGETIYTCRSKSVPAGTPSIFGSLGGGSDSPAVCANGSCNRPPSVNPAGGNPSSNGAPSNSTNPSCPNGQCPFANNGNQPQNNQDQTCIPIKCSGGSCSLGNGPTGGCSGSGCSGNGGGSGGGCSGGNCGGGSSGGCSGGSCGGGGGAGTGNGGGSSNLGGGLGSIIGGIGGLLQPNNDGGGGSDTNPNAPDPSPTPSPQAIVSPTQTFGNL